MIAMPAVVAELVVPLPYGTLRAGSRREVRATPTRSTLYLFNLSVQQRLTLIYVNYA